MNTSVDNICDQLKQTFSELTASNNSKEEELIRLRTQSVDNEKLQLTAKCQQQEEELVRLRTQSVDDEKSKCLQLEEEKSQLTSKCQQQEQIIVQLRSQFIGVPELVAKVKDSEKTIENLNVHAKFTSWLQQTYTDHFNHFLTLFQQSQPQIQNQ